MKNCSSDPNTSKKHCYTLLLCLDLGLRVLAPFMPVLAQHLHEHIPRIWDIGTDTSFPQVHSLTYDDKTTIIRLSTLLYMISCS